MDTQHAPGGLGFSLANYFCGFGFKKHPAKTIPEGVELWGFFTPKSAGGPVFVYVLLCDILGCF